MSKINRHIKGLLNGKIHPKSEDGLPSTTKVVAIRFYQGRPYYGKIHREKEPDSESSS